jgi:hypothetical protein
MNTDFTPGPQSDDYLIICPHCGSSRKAEACDGDSCEDEVEEDCEWCRNTFKRHADIRVVYNTRK